MAPKKAKKAKKDAKDLTPEEKKAKAEALALKAEEARKKKVAAMKAHVQHLKDVEDRYSKENMQKIHEKWRKIMRAAKTTELHKDIEIFTEFYDSEVKRKDNIIASLMKQLLEAEQQRELAFSKHLEIVDQLMNVHHTRMKDMETEFGENVGRLEKSFELESERSTTAHEKQKKAVSKLSEDIQTDLQKKLNIAENILKLGHLNSKLELEQEKIFPFDPLHFSSLHPSAMNVRNFKLNQGKVHAQEQYGKGVVDTSNVIASNTCSRDSQRSLAPFVTDELGKEVKEFDYLSKFHNKYNKVMLDKMALESQKKALSFEVDKLKVSLKGFVEGFTTSNDEVIKKLKLYMSEAGNLHAAASKPSNINDILRIMKKATLVDSEHGMVSA